VIFGGRLLSLECIGFVCRWVPGGVELDLNYYCCVRCLVDTLGDAVSGASGGVLRGSL